MCIEDLNIYEDWVIAYTDLFYLQNRLFFLVIVKSKKNWKFQ
jgi:hypothetical protein